MKTRSTLVGAVLCVLVGAQGLAAGGLLANGSFETPTIAEALAGGALGEPDSWAGEFPIPGWRHSPGGAYSNRFLVFDGGQSFYWNDPEECWLEQTLSQPVAKEAGTRYAVSYWRAVAQNVGAAAAGKWIEFAAELVVGRQVVDSERIRNGFVPGLKVLTWTSDGTRSGEPISIRFTASASSGWTGPEQVQSVVLDAIRADIVSDSLTAIGTCTPVNSGPGGGQVMVFFPTEGYHMEFVPPVAAYYTEDGIGFGNEWAETNINGECYEVAFDQEAVMWIESQNAARTVVRFRGALVNESQKVAHAEVESGSPYGLGDWADEWYYIYPDGVSCRLVRIYTGYASGASSFWAWPRVGFETQETFIYGRVPGHQPVDDINVDAVTLVKTDGTAARISFTPYPPERDLFPGASIQIANVAGEYRPFTIVPEGNTNIMPYHGPDADQEHIDTTVFVAWPRVAYFENGYDCALTHVINRSWYSQTANTLEQVYLLGLTGLATEEERVTALAHLARGWQYPPSIAVRTNARETHSYSMEQKAYVVSLEGYLGEELRLTLEASEERPLLNPCVVLQGWSDGLDAQVLANGASLEEGAGYRKGIETGVDGSISLVLWLPLRRDAPTELVVLPRERPLESPAAQASPASLGADEGTAQKAVPSVLFDEYHGERNTLSPERARALQPDHPEYRLFGQLAEELRALYVLDSGTSSLTPYVLSLYDVLVLAAPLGTFSQNEVAAVGSFVKHGGGLLVLGDYHLEPAVNEVLEQFGIELTIGGCLGSQDGVRKAQNFWVRAVSAQHPVIGGTCAYFANYSSAVSRWGDASVLLATDDRVWLDLDCDGEKDASERTGPFTLAVARTFGAGRVVVIGDNAFLDGTSQEGLGNRALILNAVEWLAQGSVGAGPEEAIGTSSGVTIPGLDFLGNPFLCRYPDEEGLALARTVWDMQAWNGRIYMGSGNSNNTGPAPNAGPVDVWYFDPARGEFVREFAVDEEEIEKYRVLDGRLYIPGHDSRESWELGSIYANDGLGWSKRRTLPEAVHVYDLAAHGGHLYAAGAFAFPLDPPDGGGGLWASEDDGLTWTLERHYGPFLADDQVRAGNPDDPGVWRFMDLFELGGTLYASGWGCSRVYVLRDGHFAVVNVDLFPGIESQFQDVPLEPPAPAGMSPEGIEQLLRDVRIGGFVARSVQFSDQLVYIGGVPGIDHDWIGIGAFSASNLENGNIGRLRMPSLDEEPRDLVVAGDTLYLLAVAKRADSYTTRVHATEDLNEWNVALEFEAEAPAYSLEILDGYLYIGLGGDNPSSGRVYRVPLRTGS